MSDYGGNYIIWFDWLEKTRQDKSLFIPHREKEILKKNNTTYVRYKPFRK